MIPITVPKATANEDIVTIIEILIQPNSKIKKEEVLCLLESSKSTVELLSENEGYVWIFKNEGDEVNAQETIGFVSSEKILESQINEFINMNKVQAIPSITKKAKILIEKYNINYKDLNVKGIIKETDVNTFLKNQEGHISESDEKLTFKKISASKKTEINYLSDIQSSNLTSTVFSYLNTSNIFENLNYGVDFFKDTKSFLPLIVYETSKILGKRKEFNAFYEDGNIGFYQDINVGVALDIDDGLKTVTLKETNKCNLLEIEESLFNLINKYIDKELTDMDLTGSTFTISDLSSLDVYSFIPLINKKQSAILGVSSIDKKLNRLVLSLTFDHRISEGKAASLFLADLVESLESYNHSSKESEEQVLNCSKCMKSIDEDYELGGMGLVNVETLDGSKLLCQVCFRGW